MDMEAGTRTPIEYPTIGTRVRSKTVIDRYPDFLLEEGLTGTVVSSSEELIAVKLDKPQFGAEPYGNEVHWYPSEIPPCGDSLADFWREMETI